MVSLLGHFQLCEVMWRPFQSVTTTSCESEPCRSSNLHKIRFRPSTGTSRWLPVKWRHYWSCEVMWHHFLSCHCHLPASCSSAGAQSYTKPQFSFSLLQPLPVTSGEMTSLLVTWGHVMSIAVTWLPLRASYSPVAAESYAKPQLSTFYSHSRVLPVKWCHFRSLPVTWGHVTSFPVTWLPSPATYSPVGAEVMQNPSFWHSTTTPGDFWWNHVTSRWLRDIISCQVTATSCKLQPCRSSNLHKTRVFGLLQPLPGDFQWNDVPSGSFPVTWSHVTSFPVTSPHLLWVTVL